LIQDTLIQEQPPKMPCSICRQAGHNKLKCPGASGSATGKAAGGAGTKAAFPKAPGIKDAGDELVESMAAMALSDSSSYYEEIIKTNTYINQRSESKSDVHSFTTLASDRLTQSQNIQLGISMESFLSDAVKSNTKGWVSIRTKTKKGEKETDHLYANHAAKQLIYCEQKDNINLDTEKSRTTKTKVQEITAKLQKDYPDYDVKGHILAARYLDASEDIATSIIARKYSDVSVIGVNGFLAMFGLPLIENYDIYKKIIAAICKRKFI